jgi:hypothetical protein
MVSPTGSMYCINPFRVIKIHSELLQLDWRIVWQPWEGSRSPKASIHLGITDRFSDIMDSVRISSHDIGSDEVAVGMSSASEGSSCTS